ncbi:hypothetical protein CYMTET_51332 [Cymbomonas tetramitiformis]|uniref:tRNA-uridine aminocarboxypropyltransferase n=1 Tax=Cymbomonas tetramitiformis TaxID=36881 RepID=A0AAE0BMH5_9CHLO|nr:hypothetical protein CYMTET_51332 [Cymbomonas tetramitiformis]
MVNGEQFFCSGPRSQKYVALKESHFKGHRCAGCWHDHFHCICEHLIPLIFKTATRFLIYQHYTDYLNAGDDAKLLLRAAPERTTLFVYGREGDDARLKSECERDPAATVLLFPSESALTAAEYLSQCRVDSKEPPAAHNESGNTAAQPIPGTLSIIVLDATWRHAKAMHRHFCKANPGIRQVQLHPTTLSVYARTQTQLDRICTVEALALFLQEYGEHPSVCSTLVEYIKLNNKALRGKVAAVASLYASEGGHPAWYFGRKV